VFASASDVGRIGLDALLKRAYKRSFSKDIVTVDELLNKSGTSIFQKNAFSITLSESTPSKKIISYNLRNSDNSYAPLPQCKLKVFKRSFINWSLFTLLLTSVLATCICVFHTRLSCNNNNGFFHVAAYKLD